MPKQPPIIDGEIPVIRLDRTKPYGTVHGDRTPEDPMYLVHFMQRGLPFDAQGILVPDDGKTEPYPGVVEGKNIMFKPLYTRQIREELERRIARMFRSSKEAAAEREAPELAEVPVDPADEVNLESYLRGEVDYPFYQLKKAAEARFHKKYNRLRSIIEDMIYEEKVVREAEVHPDILRILDAPDVRRAEVA